MYHSLQNPKLILWFLFTVLPSVKTACSPRSGLVHVHWEHQQEVQYQLNCETWSYFCRESGWGDAEATVLCRELGYLHGVSDYVSAGGVSRIIDSIRCSGNERRLQDCAIETVNSTTNVPTTCTSIAILSACYNSIPKAHLSIDSEKALESGGGTFEVCVHIDETQLQNITINLETVDGTALADFDFISVGQEVAFVGSGDQEEQCIQIFVVDDSLAEREEWFSVQVFSQWSSRNVPDDIVQLSILPSDGYNRCKEGSITVSSGHDNSSLQLVEMCNSNEGVWSPLCDNDWTLQDARVVCMELGYTSTGRYIPVTTGAGVIKGSSVVPVCTGNETTLVECLRNIPGGHDCHPVFIDCSMTLTVSDNESERDGTNSDDDKSEEPSSTGSPPPEDEPVDDKPGNDEEEEENEFGIAVAAMIVLIAAILAMMTSLLVVSIALVVCICLLHKNRGNVGSQRNTHHHTPDHIFVENSLYINHHTIPPAPQLNHEYATVDLLPLSSHTDSPNIYHVLEN